MAKQAKALKHVSRKRYKEIYIFQQLLRD